MTEHWANEGAGVARDDEMASFSVQITARELYDRMVMIDGKLDRVVDAAADNSTLVKDHEGRIRALEKWRYALPSALILAAVSSMADIALLAYYVTSHR